MKKSIYTLLTAITFITGATLLTSCGGGTTSETESTEQHDADHDHSEMAEAGFSCPMHLEITGKEGDKCSKCGMFLTKTSEDPEGMEEHNHKMDTVAYKCPMHPNETGVKGDKCYKCKMDLVASSTTMKMKNCKHKDGKKCSKFTKMDGEKCTHKKGKTCAKCSKEGMKCDHKKGESCAKCKKA